MNKYVIINYPNKSPALAILREINSEYYLKDGLAVFALSSVNKINDYYRYWNKDRKQVRFYENPLLYINSNFQICASDGRNLDNKGITVKLLDTSLLEELLKYKKELYNVKDILSYFNSDIFSILEDLEKIVLENSTNYLQYLELFKVSDLPILCKVADKGQDINKSTDFKLIKKDFKILEDCFITVDNKLVYQVQPLDYRLNI